jgi:flagellar biosynthesis/type III secretory pathway protein FliH
MMVAFRKYDMQFVKEFFKKEYQMLKESTFVQEWIKEGWQEGIKEGKKEGIEEGKKVGLEAGIEYGKLALLLHLVRTKFKPLNSDIESQLKKLRDKQIDDLSANLFNMQNVEELLEWLKTNETNNLK